MNADPNLKTLLSPAEMRALTQKSDLRGAWAILRVWLTVGLSFALLAAYPNPFTFVLVVLILGGQQLACAILAHEAAHRTLFKTRQLNDGLSDWLLARPVWFDVARYRQHHLRHHSHTGTAQDPDMSLVTPFPTTRASLRRKLIRDLIGRSGVRRIIGLIAMDLGILKYTVAAEVERLPRNGRSNWDYARSGIKNMAPMVFTNLLIVGVLAACGVAWVYSAWLIAYLTSFSLYVRIRSIAEHACLPGGEQILQNTRTTSAGWLARLTVAPMCVNFHQEHHLMASVPYYRLPQLHRLLSKRGIVQTAPRYREVLRIAASVVLHSVWNLISR